MARDQTEIPTMSSEASDFDSSSQSQAGSESASSSSQLSDLAEVNEAFNTSQPPKLGRLELPPTHRVYVGNLFFEATVDSLKHFAEPVGEIEEAVIQRDRRGLSKGYVYQP